MIFVVFDIIMTSFDSSLLKNLYHPSPDSHKGQNGKVMVIDRVGDSTVHFIQGGAPKGVKVGDVARYFNARSGRSMAVVSWTGSEVEYFRGMDLYRGLVSIAFRWPPQSSRSKSVTSGLNFNPMTAWVIGVLGLLMVVGVVIGSSSCRSNFAGNPGPKKPAAVSRLKLGSSGNVRGMNYRVVRHDVIECAQVASISDRNEYHLVSDGRADDLLVEGWLEDSSAWALLERVYSNPSLTPIQAGGIQAGDVVSIDGERLDVQSLVLITLIRTEGDDHNSDAPSGIRQGLVAIAGAMSYLVRWTPDQLETYRVKILPSALIRDALGK